MSEQWHDDHKKAIAEKWVQCPQMSARKQELLSKWAIGQVGINAICEAHARAEKELDYCQAELAEARAEIEQLKSRNNASVSAHMWLIMRHAFTSGAYKGYAHGTEHKLLEQMFKEWCSKDYPEAAEKEVERLTEIERLKETAKIETILAVTGMYYAAKCNHCGWIGSSKFCVEARAGCTDDCEVLCPLCSRHISDDEPSLKDVVKFLNRDVIKIVERKDKLIEQMREVLKLALLFIPENATDAIRLSEAAVSAAERINK